MGMENNNRNFLDIDLLFVGGIFPKEQEDEIIKKSKRNVQSAANGFQWNLIKGFDDNIGKPIKIMNEMFIGGFPGNYTDPIIRRKYFSHTKGAEDVNLGFINISGIKHLSKPFGEKQVLRKWATSNSDKLKVVIIYSLNPRFIRIAKLLKKINKDVVIYITVNDLPNYIMMGKIGLGKKIWKEINSYRVNRSLGLIDGFILITKQMASYLKITDKPNVVIEALIDTEEINIPKFECVDTKYKTIVYTGTLTEKYGILNLLEAFSRIQGDDYKLIICGYGETVDKIKARAEVDKRIEYKGVLNPKEIREIQQSATILVNPRQDLEEYTKYSFPIKTIEYLLAGPPVLCYKLPGIPQEYDDYLFYVKNNEIESLVESILYLCSLTLEERERIKNKNINFVLKYKNCTVQTRKILNLILSNRNLMK